MIPHSRRRNATGGNTSSVQPSGQAHRTSRWSGPSATVTSRTGASPGWGTARPATTGAATAPQVAKTNLNTATAAELDKLPQIGPVRSKAIIAARAKAKFKNWDDFLARKVVPTDAAAAIKDVVSF